MKLYFSEYSEECFTKDYWKWYLEDNNLSEIKLFEAVPDFGNGYFYCQEYGEIGEVSDKSCGKQCEFYKPRNGKNGRCRFSASTHGQGDKFIILKVMK